MDKYVKPRILVVNRHDINEFPPVRNLIQMLLAHDYYVTLISRDDNCICESIQDLKFKYVLLGHKIQSNYLAKIFTYIKETKKLKKLVIDEMANHDILWTTTDQTVRDLKKIVLNYKHIMQLMELIDYVPMFPGNLGFYFKFNIKKYAKKAWKVVVPEKNRAYIQKTIWELENLPYVLPNKPYSIDLPEPDDKISEIINEIRQEKRKILLYQGSFGDDRNLNTFAEAIEQLSDICCMYIMGRENTYSKQLCNEYTSVRSIPFLPPPYHLLITKEADIGILPYIPKKYEYYHILNAVYCAPNKLYEYSAFGLPMIGTDVPGISEPFSKYGMGCILNDFCIGEIKDKIHIINTHYDEMSIASKCFFEDTDLDKIAENIIVK